MTFANKITIMRIILIPVFIIAYIKNVPYLPLAIFTISILTDFLDGTIARRYKQKTSLGALLDPTADKLLMTSVALTLAVKDKIAFWIFIVFFSRDLIISIGWFIVLILRDSKEVNVRLPGRISTAVQFLSLFLVIADIPDYIAKPFLYFAAAATVVSGLDYITAGSRQFNLK